MSDTSDLKRTLTRRMAGLKSYRDEWDPLFRDLAAYIAPGRARFYSGEGRGQRLRGKIIDSTGSRAHRTLQSGMYTGISSPARPWFRLTTADHDLNEFQPVRQYLSQVGKRMMAMLAASNIYNALHTGYGDIGQFGVMCAILEDDSVSVLRATPLVMGQYWLGTDERGIVDTMFRKEEMTVEQIVGAFVYQGNPSGDPDWSVVSDSIRALWDRNQTGSRIEICHGIYPRTDRDPDLRDAKNKPFASVYWEAGSTDDRVLRISGYDSNPILAPRWDVTGNDIYARGPGEVALGDIKQLQAQQRDKGMTIQLGYKPPYNLPTSAANSAFSLMPGARNYIDDPGGGIARPAIVAPGGVGELVADIRETQNRIEQAFFADVFLMISRMEGIQPRNQLEMAERKEEKLQALGPVLDRLHFELLRPLITRSYFAMARDGRLPPAPEELEGIEMKIDYISILAQAQKAIATSGIERLWSFAGSLASAKPEVLDKLDEDQAIDEYGDNLGVAPSLIRSDRDAEAIRQGRQQEQGQARMAQQLAALAPAAKDGAAAAKMLSEAGAEAGLAVDEAPAADLAAQLGRIG